MTGCYKIVEEKEIPHIIEKLDTTLFNLLEIAKAKRKMARPVVRVFRCSSGLRHVHYAFGCYAIWVLYQPGKYSMLAISQTGSRRFTRHSKFRRCVPVDDGVIDKKVISLILNFLDLSEIETKGWRHVTASGFGDL